MEHLRNAALGRDADDCHPWPGNISQHGYGQAKAPNERRTIGAHVYAWLAAGNPPPEPGEQLDHTCCWMSNCPGGQGCPHRRCVNVRHLRIVDDKGNKAGVAKNRSPVCKRNHPKTAEFGYRDSQGKWYCRPCHAFLRQRSRERKLQRLAQAAA